MNRLVGNRQTQSVVLEVGLTQPLWSVVQRSPDLSVKESAASALWTATRADVEERQRVAELMGPSTFSQFLSSAALSADESDVSSELLVIGAEGIEVNTRARHTTMCFYHSPFSLNYFAPVDGEVLRSACLSVCPRAHLKNHMSKYR